MGSSDNIYKLQLPIRNSHILVADDDTTTRKIINKLLEKTGYIVTEAAGGTEALEQIRLNRVSLVLLDILMPDLNGIDTLKKIREKYSMSELPVIMVTVMGRNTDIKQALECGANDYVIKPVDGDLLKARIENRLLHKFIEDDMRKAKFELEQRVEERTHRLSEINRQLQEEVLSRKRAEQEILESREYFKSLIENVQDVIAVFEPDGTIVFESPSVERILGYRPQERVGRNTFEIVHEQDRQSVIDIFKKAFSSPGQMFTQVARFRHKNGSWRVLETYGKTVQFHGRLRGVVNARDITDHR